MFSNKITFLCQILHQSKISKNVTNTTKNSTTSTSSSIKINSCSEVAIHPDAHLQNSSSVLDSQEHSVLSPPPQKLGSINTHPMQTKAKSGISKVKVFHATQHLLHNQFLSTKMEPTSIQQAFQIPNQKQL